MTSIWDNEDLKTSDDYVKFENVGDTVTGRIINIRAHKFEDGKTAAQLLLDTTGGERTLTAGQVRLKAELAEKRPEAGDTITVTYTQEEKRAGGKTLKHFAVEIVRGNGSPASAAPADTTTPAVVDMSQLSNAQLAAIAALGIKA